MTSRIAGVILLLATIVGSPKEPSGLTVLDVRLPDGTSWTLGKKAIGRPFMVRITLANLGDAPLVLWDPDNSEGSACAWVALTDAAGERTVLRPAMMRRAGGGPTVVTLQPKQTLTYDLELLRLVGPESLPPGGYRVSAIYENRLASEPPMPAVWTGQIRGDERTIEIVAPEF